MEHFQSWSDLVNPEFYIKLGGYWLVLFIIFAETGLFVGFFLPGDSLLFISGIYAVPMVRDTFGITGSDLFGYNHHSLFYLPGSHHRKYGQLLVRQAQWAWIV